MSEPPESEPAASGGSLDRRDALLLLSGFGVFAATATADTAEAADQGQLHAEITAVLERTAEIWNSQHFSRLKEVWDGDDPEPWYVPEELQIPFHSWPAIEKYWKPGRRVLRGFRWEFSNLRVKALASDLALALFDHFYEIDLAIGPRTPPTAGFDRCLTIFRRKPEGWRHILYAQCPLGPDTYVRELRKRIGKPLTTDAEQSAVQSYIRSLREKIVRPDFAEFSDRMDKLYTEAHVTGAPPPGDPSRIR